MTPNLTTENSRGPAIIVTGATGFLGSHFLIWLDRTRRSQVFALVRGQEEAERRQKIRQALERAADAYRPEADVETLAQLTSVIQGDIERPLCGVTPKDIESLRGTVVSEFWHFAATLNFEEGKRDKISSQNIDGAINAVNLAARVGVDRFIYVSTAYTAGALEGDIPETLHDPESRFHNFYEASKCRAEHVVSDLCRRHGMKLTIFRPSVVVGPSETRRPGGSTSGIYGVVRELDRLCRTLKSTTEVVRFQANPGKEVNCIPVDCMMQDICEVIRRNFDVPNTIMHLSSARTITVGTLIGTICDQLGITNLKLVHPDSVQDTLSPIERLLAKRTVFYRPYFNSQKNFSRSLPAKWTVSDPDFAAVIMEGIRELHRRTVGNLFQRHKVTSFDGTELRVYECGDGRGPCVVLVNAFGMPVEFWSPVAERLAKQYRVLTWETRGLPSFNANFDHTRCDVDAHVMDLKAIMKYVDVSSVHLVGWCTGAFVALKAALRDDSMVRSLILLNGAYNVQEAPETDFQVNMRTVMPRVAKDRRYAAFFHRSIFLRADVASTHGDMEREAYTQFNTILGATDHDLVHLTSIPFQNVESLYRYGKLISQFIAESCSDWVNKIRQPALVLTGDQDCTAHPEGSRYVAARLPNARLVVYPAADHFALYREERVSADIVEFLHAQQTKREALSSLSS